MVTVHGPRISTATIAGLIAVIALTDIVTNVLIKGPAGVPVKVVVVSLYVVWAHRSVGLSWDELGLGRSHLRTGLLWGGGAALIVAVALTLVVVIPGTRSFLESSGVAHDSSLRRVLKPLVIIPIGTALFEETIFRGVLLGVLLRSSTRWTALIVSSVAFGLWHLPPAIGDVGGDTWVAAIGVVVGTIAVTTAAGFVFGYLRLRSGSLVAPFLAHTATNSLAYVAAVVVLHL